YFIARAGSACVLAVFVEEHYSVLSPPGNIGIPEESRCIIPRDSAFENPKSIRDDNTAG
ncbi:MAG: hypothetical protein Q9163_004607, partial [Psora crenata]